MKIVRQLISVMLPLLVILLPASSNRDHFLQNSSQSTGATSDPLQPPLLFAEASLQPIALSPYSIKEYILQDRNNEGRFFNMRLSKDSLRTMISGKLKY
jgi:hypothetical protein